MGEAIKGLLVPFIGTSLGAAAVLFWKNGAGKRVAGFLSDAAAGIMAMPALAVDGEVVSSGRVLSPDEIRSAAGA